MDCHTADPADLNDEKEKIKREQIRDELTLDLSINGSKWAA